MRHSAHRADTATNGKPAHKSTVMKSSASSRRAHAATSHRAEHSWFSVASGTSRGTHAHSPVRAAATSHRAVSRPSHAAPSRLVRGNTGAVSAAVLPNLAPRKLVALLGMTAMVGTMGVAVAANSSATSLVSGRSVVASSSVASVASFAPVNFSSATSIASATTGSTGNTVSRSSARAALSSEAAAAATSATTSSDSSQTTQGEWNLEGSSADSIDADKVSVATASNSKVQEKLESESTAVPADFNPNHATGDTAGNAYPWSQCTWWVYIRRKQLDLPVGSYFGNGAEWANSAKALGYWVDNNPQVGDVMVFARGQEGASSIYGHVAVVEKVENGVVTTSESGASLQGSIISRTFTNIHDFQYIHF